MCFLGTSHAEPPVTFNGTSCRVRNIHMNAISWRSSITSWTHWFWLLRICKTLRKAVLKYHSNCIMHRSPWWWYHAYKKVKGIYRDKSASLRDRHISHIPKHTCAHVDTHESHLWPSCSRSWPHTTLFLCGEITTHTGVFAISLKSWTFFLNLLVPIKKNKIKSMISWMCVTSITTQEGWYPGLIHTLQVTQNANVHSFFQHKESQYDSRYIFLSMWQSVENVIWTRRTKKLKEWSYSHELREMIHKET